MNRRNKALPFILATIIVVSAGLVAFQYVSRDPGEDVVQVACTMEAKICPDGSSVGRTGPTCEFAACPATPPQPQAQTPDVSSLEPWKSAHDEKKGIDFQYPEQLKTRFIQTQAWPPNVTVSAEAFTCQEGERGMEKTEKRAIQGRSYCVTTTFEGAAGSLYGTYVYRVQRESSIIEVVFTLHFAQCSNYGEPEMSACDRERQSFSVDDLADRIAMSVQY